MTKHNVTGLVWSYFVTLVMFDHFRPRVVIFNKKKLNFKLVKEAQIRKEKSKCGKFEKKKRKRNYV